MMKKGKTILFGVLFGLMLSFNASAWWGNNGWGNNGWGNNGYYGGYNNWPAWTPMYWMDEMSNGWGGNNWGGNNWGGNRWSPWGGNNWGPWGARNNGYYGYGPYGPGQMMPYGAYPEVAPRQAPVQPEK